MLNYIQDIRQNCLQKFKVLTQYQISLIEEVSLSSHQENSKSFQNMNNGNNKKEYLYKILILKVHQYKYVLRLIEQLLENIIGNMVARLQEIKQ